MKNGGLASGPVGALVVASGGPGTVGAIGAALGGGGPMSLEVGVPSGGVAGGGLPSDLITAGNKGCPNIVPSALATGRNNGLFPANILGGLGEV